LSDLELKTIRSTLAEGDIDVLFGEGVSDFFTSYGDLWEYSKKYYGMYGKFPDPEVVHEAFPDAGLDKIEAKGHPKEYMDRLRQEFLTQRVNRIAVRMADENRANGGEHTLRALEEQMELLRKYYATSVTTNIMDFDQAERHYEEVREKVAAGGGTPGIPTGVNFFDSAYPTGFQPGDLIVVLGWTGRAKSFFTTLVAANSYMSGRTPMIASLEMDANKLRDRVFTTMGKGKFRNSGLVLGDFEVDQFNQFRKEAEGKGKFLIVEGDGRSEVSPSTLQVKHNQYKPDIHIWDYAQLMGDNAGSIDPITKMKNISNEAKAFATANKVPVVLISSATPDGKVDDVPPTVEQVAYSKQLAYNADLAIAVHKRNNSNLIDIVCRKNRNGPLFAGTLDWDIDAGVWKETDL